jgi:hypothetical protein
MKKPLVIRLDFRDAVCGQGLREIVDPTADQ